MLPDPILVSMVISLVSTILDNMLIQWNLPNPTLVRTRKMCRFTKLSD